MTLYKTPPEWAQDEKQWIMDEDELQTCVDEFEWLDSLEEAIAACEKVES